MLEFKQQIMQYILTKVSFRIKPFSVWQKKIDEILEIQAQRQYEASLTDPVLDTTTNPNPNDTTTPDTTTPINL